MHTAFDREVLWQWLDIRSLKRCGGLQEQVLQGVPTERALELATQLSTARLHYQASKLLVFLLCHHAHARSRATVAVALFDEHQHIFETSPGS